MKVNQIPTKVHQLPYIRGSSSSINPHLLGLQPGCISVILIIRELQARSRKGKPSPGSYHIYGRIQGFYLPFDPPRKGDKLSKKNLTQISLPAIDGKMSDAKYFAKNSFIYEDTLITKAQMKTEFKNRFGYFPEEIFFGKPNGSLIFAGPLLTGPVIVIGGSLIFTPVKEVENDNQNK